MSMTMKYPRKYSIRLSEKRSDELIAEAGMPDVDAEPSALARTLIEEGLDKRKRRRKGQRVEG